MKNEAILLSYGVDEDPSFVFMETWNSTLDVIRETNLTDIQVKKQ